MEAVCLKCLAKSPDERYATARELADDLGRWQQGYGVQARPLPSAERLLRATRRSPLVPALIAAIVLMAIVLAVFLARANYRLAARGNELDRALRASRITEARAIAAETEATAATCEADRQRWQTDTNLQTAVKTAYQADLPRGFTAVQNKRFAEANCVAGEVQRYARGTTPLGTKRCHATS